MYALRDTTTVYGNQKCFVHGLIISVRPAVYDYSTQHHNYTIVCSGRAQEHVGVYKIKPEIKTRISIREPLVMES